VQYFRGGVIVICHSGAPRSGEPGIQTQTLCLHLDSGFTRFARAPE